MTALHRYIAIVLTDGDYLNDYLTHLPLAVRPLIAALGQLLAGTLWVLIGA